MGDRHWVFELKFAKDTHEVEALLTTAVEQVKRRRYGETTRGKELLRLALVFNAQTRSFEGWQMIN